MILRTVQMMINDLNRSSLCHHGYGQAERPPAVAAWLVIKGDPHLVHFLLARFSNSLHYSWSSVGGELAQRRAPS